jgi:hypothetical protein
MLITGTNETEYLNLIEERKKEVVRLVLKGLKPGQRVSKKQKTDQL